MENPSDVKGKNHGHQPATISLSQEFWVTRIWRLTRESSLHETLARVYIPYGPSLRRRASASLRQKPGLYSGVNLEQLQHIQHDVDARPTMAEVVQALEGLTDFRVATGAEVHGSAHWTIDAPETVDYKQFMSI